MAIESTDQVMALELLVKLEGFTTSMLVGCSVAVATIDMICCRVDSRRSVLLCLELSWQLHP